MKFFCLAIFCAGILSGEVFGQEKILPGTKWETPVFVTDSGVEGPTVLITGGIHGNEPAGAMAAGQMRHWPVVKGKLVVIPRVNVTALAVGERRIPEVLRERADLNRNFPITGGPDVARGELAEAVWDFVKGLEPDWVLDLHEGFAINRQNPKSVGSTILCSPSADVKPIFEHALAAVNASIEDPGKLFRLHAESKTVNGGLVRASMERLGAVGAILETTYADQPLAVRVRQHRLMVHRILRDLGMIENGPDALVFLPEDDGRMRVAIFEDAGVGGPGPGALRQRFDGEPARYFHRTIGGPEIRGGVLADFDVVIFPGGSGSRQSATLGEKGRAEVRDFVEGGGGFVGICAGCYLACEGFSWGLKILDARTKSSKWRRGRADLELEFSKDLSTTKSAVMYANGPILEPANAEAIPDFETLAIFKTEVAENGAPAGIQVDSPAIVRGRFGEGRVVGISPHPEQTDGMREVVPVLLDWAVGGSGQ